MKLVRIFAILVIAFSLSPAGAGEQVRMQPTNPQFEASRLLGPQLTSRGRALGYVPAPLNLSHLNIRRARSNPSGKQLPATYDLRDDGMRITPVKDQGGCGSCWAFGAYSSLESNHMPDEVLDLAEQHLNANHGFDNSECMGGNHTMSTAYLSRWEGPLDESDDPYPYSHGPTPVKHVQEVLYMGDRVPDDPSLNDFVKEAVMDLGAVYTSYRHLDLFYSSSNSSYYYSGNFGSNHAVTIIGWDDNFPKENFWKDAPGDGAFIIKGSWGEDFGEDGFYYISYYDSLVRNNTVFVRSEPIWNYDGIYQHDWLGWTASIGNSGLEEQPQKQDSTTFWGANIFEAEGEEVLAAAGFYTTDYDTTYRLQIYLDVESDPGDGTLAGETTGTFRYAGYHTVALDDMDVVFSAGTRFSVVIEFVTSGYEYPLAVEHPIFLYSGDAEASAGQSFFRASDAEAWTDMTEVYEDTNASFKAFTLLACNDADPCTNDIWNGSDCEFTEVECDDGRPCTSDSCDSVLGCLAEPLSDGTQCDDDDACTLSDSCSDGICLGADPVECLAEDECHLAGVCDPGSGVCSNPAVENDTPCDDGDQCSQVSTCQAGVCEGGDPIEDGTACDDQSACTSDESCQSGVCTGTAVECVASDECHAPGTCDPATGECDDPPLEDGSSCDDGDLCTQADSCLAGNCTGEPVECGAEATCYQAGTCDPETGDCVELPEPDGSACDDGDACTQTDSCLAGECQGADPLECTASDTCHVPGTCDPESGVCSDPLADDGTICPGGTCQDGVCLDDGSDPDPDPEPDESGCGCGTRGKNASGWLAMLLILGAVLRRRKP